MLHRVLKISFFALFIRPFVFIFLGLNLRGRKNLPEKGPAIVSANHNSHLDTLVLISLFPLKEVHRVRPIAAADYFFKHPVLAWIAINIIGIIPIERKEGVAKEHIFDSCHHALNREEILILYPEGSRGIPEKMGEIKKGLYHLVCNREDSPRIIPVVMHGLGRVLPKGEKFLIPFNCDVIIGEPLNYKHKDSSSEEVTLTVLEFVDSLKSKYNQLFKYCLTRPKF